MLTNDDDGSLRPLGAVRLAAEGGGSALRAIADRPRRRSIADRPRGSAPRFRGSPLVVRNPAELRHQAAQSMLRESLRCPYASSVDKGVGFS